MRYRCPYWLILLVLLFAIDCASMQRCRRAKELPAKSTDTVTVAVLDYLNVMNDPKLESLVRGIPDSLSAHLTRRGTVRIIERDRVVAALKELGLSMTGFMDESSGAQVGCTVSADAIIKGSLLKLGKFVQMSTWLVEVRTSSALHMEQMQGSSHAELFALMDPLAAIMNRRLFLSSAPGSGD